MTTFNWSIRSLKHNLEPSPEAGGVTEVIWQCELLGADGEQEDITEGAFLLTPDINSLGFKPYDTLTEANVLEWCFANTHHGIPRVDKNEVESEMIEKTAYGVPWDA